MGYNKVSYNIPPTTMTLCEIKRKDINKDPKRLIKMLEQPEYVCQKCLRSASKKKYLCKPSSLFDLGQKS